MPASDIAAEVWALAGGNVASLESVVIDGPAHVLPSAFEVTAVATGVVAAATLAIAEFDSARRNREIAPVVVDSRHSTWSFRDEKHVQIDGETPQVWADLSGYYATSDGFVQIHANFPHHAARALDALGLPSDADREMVEAELFGRDRFEVEDLIVANNGICSAFRSLDEWRQHPHAVHLGSTPPLLRTERAARDHAERAVSQHVIDTMVSADGSEHNDRPLAGVRVLDLTRILAGPVAARTMAAFGADVIRIGAEDLPSHELSVALTSVGKRFAHIDLRTEPGRETLMGLAASADVVLTGFRPGSLAALGVDQTSLRSARPDLVIAELSAFGATGPWGGRRGFDSITQTASGIAHEGMRASGGDAPTPLPCQLLDYASGYLLATGIVRSLTDRLSTGSGYDVEVVLARTGRWLEALGRVDHGLEVPLPSAADVAEFQQERPSPFGLLNHMSQPGSIGGLSGEWTKGPERPGQSEARW